MNAPARSRSPAVPVVLDELLARLGVMQRAPSSWRDSPRLDPVPVGALPFAVAPRRPRAASAARGPRRPSSTPTSTRPCSTSRSRTAWTTRAIVSRYLRQLVTESPEAARRALDAPRLVATTDDVFAATLTETSIGQFVRPVAATELPGPSTTA